MDIEIRFGRSRGIAREVNGEIVVERVTSPLAYYRPETRDIRADIHRARAALSRTLRALECIGRAAGVDVRGAS